MEAIIINKANGSKLKEAQNAIEVVALPELLPLNGDQVAQTEAVLQAHGDQAAHLEEDPQEKVTHGDQAVHLEVDPQEKAARGAQVAQLEDIQETAVQGAQEVQVEASLAQVNHGLRAAHKADIRTEMVNGSQ